MVRQYSSLLSYELSCENSENYVYKLSNALNMNSWGINLENNSSLILEK